MAKRKQTFERKGIKGEIPDTLKPETHLDVQGTGRGKISMETVPMQNIIKDDLPKPEKPTKTIHTGPEDNIESLTSHHYKSGAGEVNKAELEVCMEMLISHVITFYGAYHDNRKKEFYNHLASHYKELGLVVPPLK